MENLNKELSEFVEQIRAIELTMLKDYKIDGDFSKNAGKFPRTGSICYNNETISYKFHGAGCTFIYDSGLILDYDYTSEMASNINFSPWKFNRFLESKTPAVKLSQQDLLNHLEKMVSEGLLTKHPKGFFLYGLN